MVSKSKSKAKKSPAKKAPAKKAEGDHVRVMPDKKLILSLSKEMDLTLQRSSVLSGEFGQSMRDAKERGVNLPAFRLAKRFHRKAKDDAIAGAILWEDFNYYLEECLEFGKMIAPSMFKAGETRSGKNGKGKNGGKAAKEPEQRDLSQRSDLPAGGGDAAADAGETTSVH